ncbi:unnamed protein product [Soboliphyme baturini]|uniref:MBD domain-containing protein n=1 Tax=Soboliphyme baturini TaxID=241478 RepID=A0A183J9Y8_9BILA|nr:unnamed protein product [Soboliphyme baturini]
MDKQHTLPDGWLSKRNSTHIPGLARRNPTLRVQTRKATAVFSEPHGRMVIHPHNFLRLSHRPINHPKAARFNFTRATL